MQMESKLFRYNGHRYEVMIYDGSNRFRISQLWRNRVLSTFYCDTHGARQAFNALGDADSYTDSKARRYFAQIDYNCSVFDYR